MKNNCIYLSIVFFLLQVSSIMAQDVPTLMTMPTKYIESPDGDLLSEGDKSKKSNQTWIVFSDRDDNKAYSNPSIATPISTVNFLDKFYVTGESGEFLEVYKWADGIKMEGAGKRLQLNPKKAVRVGWIKKDYLLLWTRCLVNKENQFSEKALAVFNAENLTVELRKDNSLKIFNSPDPEIDKENKNTVKMFNFLYVYKSKGKRVLIGKVYKSNVYRTDRDILGWVDTIFLQRWADRVCLQPNDDLEAVTSRKSAGVKASMFDEKDQAIEWKKGMDKTPIWDDDTYEKPWSGTKQRLPIFRRDKMDIVYTGYPTPLFKEGSTKGGTSGEVVMDITELDKAKREYYEIVNKLRQINIVFVIDAGFGMRNYANAITNSLKQLIKKREDMNGVGEKRNRFKYGAVIYRSDEDKVCPGGNLSLNKSSLTANASSIVAFLNTEFENEGCSSNELNKNVNGALLEGLNMIKDANKESLQSNYIFFLGGATGNTAAELQTAPALIAQYDVNISVFQVNNAAVPVEFEQFPFQFQDILLAAKEKKKELTAKAFRSEILFKMVQGDQNLFRLDYPNTSPIQGNINFPEKGQTIPSSTIDNILDETISDYEITLENTIGKLEAIIKGYDQKGVTLNATVRNILNRLGKKMEDYELALKFNGKNVQFFIPAWTTATVNKVDKPIFKYVIYVQEDELSDMINKFEKLQIEAPPSEMREMMYDAYQSLVAAYFGIDSRIDEQMKNKLSISDILTKITGLPSSSQLLKEIKINEIKDVGKVSEEQIDDVAKRIRDSLENLKNVKKDLKGTMRDATDDGVYYYVPQEYLP